MKNSSLSLTISNDVGFPDPRVVRLYAKPSISSNLTDSDVSRWYIVRDVYLTGIADFCTHQLQWVDDKIKALNFSQVVFPAVVRRMLNSPLTFYDPDSKKLLSAFSQIWLSASTTPHGFWIAQYQFKSDKRNVVSGWSIHENTRKVEAKLDFSFLLDGVKALFDPNETFRSHTL
ncbi:hypothetical protein BJ165DRAFT_1409841 [Panaeolus papilionaceus]|nr:hypothetical protein BJ165DRAFT_1409841 [Panaeolus papilionaceus]